MEEACPEQQSHADSLLAHWVAKSLCPISALQDPAFARYLQYVSSASCRFSAPASAWTQYTIENKAARLRNNLETKISKDCEFFSLSSEIWTSMTAGRFMTITLHYVNENFDMSSSTLDVVNLPTKYDDKMVERALKEVFTKWQLPMEKCTGFVQKSGQNIPKACENLGLKSLPCIAHSLDLIVGAVLLQKKEDILEEDWMFEGNKTDVFNGKKVAGVNASDEELDSLWTEIDTLLASTSASRDELETVRCVVHRFRKLAMFFLRSQRGAAQLDELKYRKYRRSVQLDVVMDCHNWRSTMVMLSHLIKLQPVLNAFFEYLHSDAGVEEFGEMTRTMLYNPTEEDWFTIKCLKKLLVHFSAFADEMQRSKYSSLALALPGIRALSTMLLDEMFDPVLDCVQEEGLKSRLGDTMLAVSRSFTELLDTSFDGLNAEMSWISLLDPRFTDTKLLTATEKRGGEERLVAEMFETAKAAKVSTSDTIPIKEDLERPNKKRRSAYWEQLYGGRNAAQESAADTDSVLLEECKWEFSKYFRDSAAAKDTVEPLKWWKEKRTDFPKLAPLARKWLGCIATSVPSEQAFSKTSNATKIRRSTLEFDIVGDILLIAENGA